MFTITEPINVTLQHSFDNNRYEDLLFFDIETTGFSADVSTIYLIGCTYYKNNTWNYIQWFADDKNSESSVLTCFFEFMSNYKILIHFNGDGFDIPFIQKRCIKNNLDYSFCNIQSLDIYKQVKPLKKYLNLENCKQKCIENFLKISREDIYSGGELIQVYKNFLKCQALPKDSPSKKLTLNQLQKILLCHNKDDVVGLILISQVLNYSDFFNSHFKIKNAQVLNSSLEIEASFETNLPILIQNTDDTRYFCAHNNHLIIKIPIYTKELKYFYDNYTDYYYLPKEDTAIHKSIAVYVDKDFKTKAKAANCYTKKTGHFIPQFQTIHTPYFKISYKDKHTYIEITEELLKDTSFLEKYIKHLLYNH